MNNSSIPARLYAMADKRLLIMLAVIIGDLEQYPALAERAVAAAPDRDRFDA